MADRDAPPLEAPTGTMPTRQVADIEELKTLVGQEVGVSDWTEITQDRIDRFADATDDHQWIHVDVERCARESPFGAPIAHGYLTPRCSPFSIPRPSA